MAFFQTSSQFCRNIDIYSLYFFGIDVFSYDFYLWFFYLRFANYNFDMRILQINYI